MSKPRRKSQASFIRKHFDPHSKKKIRRNKSRIAKFLNDNQNMKNLLKQKHLSFNGESSVIELLQKIFFKTSVFCLFIF